MPKKVETLMPWHLVLDTETTGLSAQRQDVIQVAGILRGPEGEALRFEYKCQPHRWDTVEQGALDVHGYQLNDLKTFENPQRVAQDLRRRLSEAFTAGGRLQLVAHNMPFDYRFMKEWWFKCGFQDWDQWFLPQDECICTKKWGNRAKKQLDLPIASGKLIDFAEFLGIEFDAHDALGDTIACVGILDWLLTTGVDGLTGGPSPAELHEEGKQTMDEIEEIHADWEESQKDGPTGSMEL